MCDTNISNNKGGVNGFFGFFERKTGVWRPGSGAYQMLIVQCVSHASLPARRFIKFANLDKISRVTSFVTSLISNGTFTGKPEAGGRVKLRHAAGPVKLRHAVSQGYPQMGIGREVGGRVKDAKADPPSPRLWRTGDRGGGLSANYTKGREFLPLLAGAEVMRQGLLTSSPTDSIPNIQHSIPECGTGGHGNRNKAVLRGQDFNVRRHVLKV